MVGFYLGLTQNSIVLLSSGLIAFAQAVYSFSLNEAQKQRLRAPEYAYNYGYGKYDSLATVFSGGLLALGGLIIGYYSIYSFDGSGISGADQITMSLYSIIALAGSLGASIYSKAAAKRTENEILQREGELKTNDVYMRTFVFALTALIIALSTRDYVEASRWTDIIGGLSLIGLALVAPLKSLKGAFEQLLDSTLPEEIQFEIIAAIADNIDKICEFRSVHTRRAGKGIFIEIDVVLPWNYTLEKAFEIERELAAPLLEKYPDSIVRVYVVPCDRDCPTGGEKDCPPIKKKAPGLSSERDSK